MKLFVFFAAALAALGLSVPAQAAPSLSQIYCHHNSFTGAGTNWCSVFLNDIVSDGAESIALSSNNPSVVLSNPRAYIPTGHYRGGFALTIAPVNTNQTATITATLGGQSVSYRISLNAVTTAPSDQLSAITCQSSSFSSQGTDSCSANLAAAATTSDAVVLTSNNASVVPTGSVSIAQGTTSIAFSIAVTAVTAQQTATITATLGASTARYTLTLYPPNSPAQHTVSLTWDAPESNGDAVAGYHIYRSAGSNTASFAEISAQSTTSFVDTDVSGGSSYTYVVRSVDADGVESSNSNTAVVTVPAT